MAGDTSDLFLDLDEAYVGRPPRALRDLGRLLQDAGGLEQQLRGFFQRLSAVHEALGGTLDSRLADAHALPSQEEEWFQDGEAIPSQTKALHLPPCSPRANLKITWVEASHETGMLEAPGSTGPAATLGPTQPFRGSRQESVREAIGGRVSEAALDNTTNTDSSCVGFRPSRSSEAPTEDGQRAPLNASNSRMMNSMLSSSDGKRSYLLGTDAASDGSITAHDALVLNVKIVAAQNLRDADNGVGQGCSDPYCQLEVVGKPQTRVKTEVINDDLNPVWNFETDVTDWEFGDELLFQVFDKDLDIKDDDFLGGVRVPSSMFFPDGFLGALDLEDAGMPDARLKIEIRIDYDDTFGFMHLVGESKKYWENTREKTRETRNFRGSAGAMGSMLSVDLGNVIAQTQDVQDFSPFGRIEDWKRSGDMVMAGACAQHFVRHPSSRAQVTFDLLSMLLLAYDAIMIPLVAAFDLPMQGPLLYLTVIIAFFWFQDLVGSFFKGYYQGSNESLVEMRMSRIAARYLKGYFFLDVFLVVLDMCFIIVAVTSPETNGSGAMEGQESRAVRGVRLVRVARTVRMLSVFRLLKHRDLASSFSWGALTQFSIIVCQITYTLLVLLLITHYCACFWFGITEFYEARDMNGNVMNWIVKNDLTDYDKSFLYLTSYHYILTQFTPASMSLLPSNATERVYTLIIDILGMVLFSSFVSSITTRMTALRMLNQDKMLTQENLRRLFRQNRVSLEVTQSIYAIINRRSWSGRRVHAKTLSLVKDLPQVLKVQLYEEIYMPFLVVHPFFCALFNVEREFGGKFCCEAIEERAEMQKNTIFVKGEEGSTMFFVASGKFQYKRLGKMFMLRTKDWICEPTIWIDGWKTRGQLVATERSELIHFDSIAIRKQLIESADIGSTMRQVACKYAMAFLDTNAENDVVLEPTLRLSDLWMSKLSTQMQTEMVLADPSWDISKSVVLATKNQNKGVMTRMQKSINGQGRFWAQSMWRGNG